jgi:hypothetical protein
MIFALAGFLFCIIGLLQYKRAPKKFSALHPTVLMISLLLFLISSSVHIPAFFLTDGRFVIFHTLSLWVLVALLPIAYFLAPHWQFFRRSIFFLALGIGFAFRIALPQYSPEPIVDVFSSIQQSAAHILQGKNPYATPIQDVYEQAPQPELGYTATTYFYPPANLPFQVGAFILGRDIRYATVFAEMVVAWTVWHFARRRVSASSSELFVLLFLFHVRALYILEMGWTDPLIFMMFGLSLLAYDRGYAAPGALAYGYFLSMKQYLAYLAIHWLLLERRWRYLLLGIMTGMLTAVPFLFLDPVSFWNQGVLFLLHVPFRADGLTVFSVLYRLFGIVPSKLWTAAIGGIAALLSLFLFRKERNLTGYLFATSITMFAIFLFGTQAFCNYYYFLSGIMLFLLITLQNSPQENTLTRVSG